MNLADNIAQAIVADLTDRKALGDVWWSIDTKTRYEIMERWRFLIREELREVFSELVSELGMEIE